MNDIIDQGHYFATRAKYFLDDMNSVAGRLALKTLAGVVVNESVFFGLKYVGVELPVSPLVARGVAYSGTALAITGTELGRFAFNHPTAAADAAAWQAGTKFNQAVGPWGLRWENAREFEEAGLANTAKAYQDINEYIEKCESLMNPKARTKLVEAA